MRSGHILGVSQEASHFSEQWTDHFLNDTVPKTTLDAWFLEGISRMQKISEMSEHINLTVTVQALHMRYT